MRELYASPALYIDQVFLSNYGLLLVIVLLLLLIALLLFGIPIAIKTVKR